jgi:two-component system OmpR family sensor kinase
MTFARLSLRSRLFAGLVGALAVSWALWFGCQALQMSRQQTGLWDTSLQSIAQQILQSLPGTLHHTDFQATASYRLPEALIPVPGDAAAHGNLSAALAYQVWSRDGRLLLRSALAPATALKPDSSDGFGTPGIAGEVWRVYAVSDRDGQVQVQVGKPQRALDDELQRWLAFSLIVTLGLLVVVGGMLWGIVSLSLRPVAVVQRSLTQRDPKDLRPVPDQTLPAELRPLVQSFNRLLARLDSALEGERRFIADAAHELRTPLAVLLAQAELARKSVPEGEAAATLDALIGGAQRSTRLVEQLLDLARMDAADALPRAAVPLHEVASLLARDFEAAARGRGQRITVLAEPCEVQASLDALGIALRNLIDNAVQHGRAGGRVQISVRCAGNRAVLEVADDGPGVPAEARPHVFDRFWRGRDATQRGSGLGLSLVARIAGLHRAELNCGPGLDGAGFGVQIVFDCPVLPASEAAPRALPARDPGYAAAG